MRRLAPIALALVAACGGRAPSTGAAPTAARPPTGDPLVGCFHEPPADADEVEALVCPDLMVEARAVAAGEGELRLGQVVEHSAKGAVEETELIAGDRSYPGRRFRFSDALPRGFATHTQLGSSEGYVFQCATRRPAAGDDCRRVIARIVEVGWPPAAPPEPSILGTRFVVPEGCTLTTRDVSCHDDSRLSWKVHLDAAQLAAEMQLGEQAPCRALGRPATCIRGKTEIFAGDVKVDELSSLNALVEKDGFAASILCSWLSEGPPPPLCGLIFSPTP